MRALPIAPPPKLRVTTAETEHMPFYLRIFFEYCPLAAPQQAERLDRVAPAGESRAL